MPTSRRAIVTCGPGLTPIDAVRRITNFSTGELGVRLSECLLDHGWEVICFKSAAATYRNPEGGGLTLREFTTNTHLEELLATTPEAPEIAVVFHAAALGDYVVDSIHSLDGHRIEARKISSRLSGLQVTLKPAPKVLPKLKTFFPNAKVVGWKFELEGDQASALEAGHLQILENSTALSVINGAAFGDGFGILDPQGACRLTLTRSELCQHLAMWAKGLVAKPLDKGLALEG